MRIDSAHEYQALSAGDRQVDKAGRVERLEARLVEKPWGVRDLPAAFGGAAGGSIGEVVYEPHPALEHLLVKFLFTSEKLSVQVHPCDADALPGEAGKDECWLVLDAEPDAELAIGFRHEVAVEEMLAAARDGSIEALLERHAAIPGRFFHLPAGTIHAVGAGVTLLEVQQASDTTFRLYDYGRPRALHLERAAAVAHRTPYVARHHALQPAGDAVLVDGPHFRLERVIGAPGEECQSAFAGGCLALALSGDLRAESGEAIKLGECVYAPSIAALDFARAGTTMLVR